MLSTTSDRSVASETIVGNVACASTQPTQPPMRPPRYSGIETSSTHQHQHQRQMPVLPALWRPGRRLPVVAFVVLNAKCLRMSGGERRELFRNVVQSNAALRLPGEPAPLVLCNADGSISVHARLLPRQIERLRRLAARELRSLVCAVWRAPDYRWATSAGGGGGEWQRRGRRVRQLQAMGDWFAWCAECGQLRRGVLVGLHNVLGVQWSEEQQSHHGLCTRCVPNAVRLLCDRMQAVPLLRHQSTPSANRTSTA